MRPYVQVHRARLTYTERTFGMEFALPRTIGRTLLWAYALLMIVAAVGYARYDTYMMDGDGTAFLDIAQDLNTHRAALAINGYWNPGYPAVLAVAERIGHPTLWRELAFVRFTNVIVFMAAMACCVSFTTALTRGRSRQAGKAYQFAIPDGAVHLLGLALLVLSMGRELPIAAPRADTLLLALLLLAGGLLLRILDSAQPLLYAGLGVALGCAYLTKSFAFLPSMALFVALLIRGARQPSNLRVRAVTGTLLAMLLFSVVAGPYVFAISRQLGHLTTGDSARLNYAFFVDMTPRWHEWYHHDLGHAGGNFLHPEAVLNAQPPVFSYAAHPNGTFPLWFDPAWWTAGLKPHIWVKGHVLRLVRNIVVFFRYLLGRPEIFVLLAVLLAWGASVSVFRKDRESARSFGPWWAMAPMIWGALMFLIYLPIDLQDRYLTGPLLLLVLPLFASLRVPRTLSEREVEKRAEDHLSLSPVVASALVLLFAGIALSQSVTYLAERRRHTPTAEQRHPGFDPQIFSAAAALDHLGLQPGDKVACMGDLACYTDFYWARLAGTQILGEVETPDEASPLTVWNDVADKRTVTAPLARMGLRYIVTLFPNSATKPDGWIQLGGTNFFAYPLQAPVNAGTAAATAAFQPTP